MVISFWRLLLLLWLACVLFVISLPWAKFDGSPHWENVLWIPFSGLVFSAATLVETGINVLAFIPIGYLLVRSLPPAIARPLLLALLLGLCCSISAELYQLFCRDRVPSTTDVLTNVAGTVLGARMALGVDQLLSLCTVRLRRLSS